MCTWSYPLSRLLPHLSVKWGWWPFMVPGLVPCSMCIIALIKRCPLALWPHVLILLEDFFFFFLICTPVRWQPLQTLLALGHEHEQRVRLDGAQMEFSHESLKGLFICINGKTLKDYIMDWVRAIRLCVCRCTPPCAFACANQGWAAFHATDLMPHLWQSLFVAS